MPRWLRNKKITNKRPEDPKRPEEPQEKKKRNALDNGANEIMDTNTQLKRPDPGGGTSAG